MSDPWRVGIVGAGRIAGLFADPSATAPATTHAAALSRDGGFSLVAVCDRDQERARRFTATWGGRPYPGVEGLLSDTRPDVVVIAAPDTAHAQLAELVLASAAAPRLLVIEKPPCLGRLEWAALLERNAAAPDTTVIVNMSRRFDAGHRAVARAIAARSFGEPVEAVGTYYGGWLHNGIHAVDTMRMLLGEDLRVTSSSAGADGHPGDPCRDVMLTAPRRPAARIALRGFDERNFQLFEMDLRFSDGRVRLEDFGTRVIAERVHVNDIGERELHPSGEFEGVVGSTPMMGLYCACARFLADAGSGALDDVELAAMAGTMEVLFDAAA